LEDLLHDRQEINERLRESVQEAAKSWGLEILRCEVNHVNPADSILEAMNEKVFNDLQNKKQVLPLTPPSAVFLISLSLSNSHFRLWRLLGSREKLSWKQRLRKFELSLIVRAS
jgi:hypothetical protein